VQFGTAGVGIVRADGLALLLGAVLQRFVVRTRVGLAVRLPVVRCRLPGQRGSSRAAGSHASTSAGPCGPVTV
jgi:hypothetical protein